MNKYNLSALPHVTQLLQNQMRPCESTLQRQGMITCSLIPTRRISTTRAYVRHLYPHRGQTGKGPLAPQLGKQGKSMGCALPRNQMHNMLPSLLRDRLCLACPLFLCNMAFLGIKRNQEEQRKRGNPILHLWFSAWFKTSRDLTLGEEKTRAQRHGCSFLLNSGTAVPRQVVSENARFKVACSAPLGGDFQPMCVIALVETMPRSQGRVSYFQDKIGCASSDC